MIFRQQGIELRISTSGTYSHGAPEKWRVVAPLLSGRRASRGFRSLGKSPFEAAGGECLIYTAEVSSYQEVITSDWDHSQLQNV
jgi:hypothetical protein